VRLPTVACRTFEAARAMVLAGPVIGYAPLPLVAAGLRSGQLSEIRYPLERLQGGAAILTLRGRTPSAAATALIAELRSVDGAVAAK
jgi:DNA-binding transcriptional LysR family regulator